MDWAGRPHIQLLPPAPPSLPPPAPSLEFSFATFAVVICTAATLACAALLLQYVLCVWVAPRYRRRQSRLAVERKAAEAAAAVRRKEAELEEERSQIAPAPRVRALAWVGTDVERATSSLPPVPLPPLHANPRKPRAKVAPAAPAGTLEHELPSEILAEAWTAGRVLFGTFSVAQTVIAAVVGFGVSYGVFRLLLIAGGPFPLEDARVLLMLVLSPVMSALLAPAFVPMAMPEAAESGWLGHVPPEWLPPPMLCLPFLHARHAAARHALLAVSVASLWIPGGLLVLTQLLRPPYSAAEIALFAGAYNFSISFATIPLGILGFSLTPNFDRAISMMSMEDNKLRRLLERLLMVPMA